MTVTSTLLRTHVETDLDDYALELLIEDAYAAILQRRGARAELVYRSDGGGAMLFVDPPADAVTTVTEDGTEIEEDTDFRLRYGGRALQRIGRNWGQTVVEYDASDDDPRTDRVVIDLCKLALQYEGLQSSSDGDYRETHLPYQDEREKLLAELTIGMGFR